MSSANGELLELLLGHRRELLAFLERRLGDRSAAEDVLHQALLRVLEQAGSVPRPGAARAYLYRVLRNAAIDRRRKEERRARIADELGHEPAEDAAPDDPPPCRCVLDVARNLRPTWARVLERVTLDGERVAGFAAEEGITRGNAAVRLHRAREALRRGVQATCGSCAADGCTSCTCTHPATR